MRKGFKVLIVEDDDSLRSLMDMYLSQWFNVIAKRGCIEAWAWLQYGDLPDVIVLDDSLAGIESLELIDALQKSDFYADIPMIAILSSQNESFLVKCKNYGLTDILEKPIDLTWLREIIASISSSRPC